MGRVIRCRQQSKSERRETAKQSARLKKSKSGYSNIVPFKEDSARTIEPMNDKQRLLISTIKTKTLTFATGCAGTGKTRVAIATAISLLLEGAVERVILTTPDWCVGKGIGIVPGGVEEKTAMMFSTIKEMVIEILGASRAESFEKLKKIRYIHLSEVLGKTFNDAIIIMDEAQVSSLPEMKVFLTRLGLRSRIVLCGDHAEQSYRSATNGLEDAIRRFITADEVGRINFTINDIVRHDFLKTIISGYRDNIIEEE